jgi:transposase
MARPLSNDLRERVVARHLEGESIRSVAASFGVAASTVSKWAQRQRATGSVGPAKFGGYRRRRLEAHRETVVELVASKPDRPVRELREALAALGIETHAETLRRFLHAEGLSFKKKRVRQ